ncbi:MAG: hypothetical protein EOO00_06735 [Chitinophagaceae bacterium]|nr:MAG: hypothetical protein EOO00_06735 [Chitinophagaceae bacterium]
MTKNKDNQAPRLSRSERRRLEEEERIKLQRWVEEKQHNEIFQQTLRDFSRRRGSKLEYDPNDKDSVWKILQAQPDYDPLYNDPEYQRSARFSRIIQRLLLIIGAILVLILIFMFYLTIKESNEKKFTAKPAMIYRFR